MTDNKSLTLSKKTNEIRKGTIRKGESKPQNFGVSIKLEEQVQYEQGYERCGRMKGYYARTVCQNLVRIQS